MIGVVVALLIIAIVVGVFWVRRRKQDKKDYGGETDVEMHN